MGNRFITGLVLGLIVGGGFFAILWLFNSHGMRIEFQRLAAEYEQKLEIARFEADLYKKAVRIIVCESTGRHNNVYGRHGEYGIAQFKRETFQQFAEEMGEPELQWRNKWHQLKVLLWAIAYGKENHWACK